MSKMGKNLLLRIVRLTTVLIAKCSIAELGGYSNLRERSESNKS